MYLKKELQLLASVSLSWVVMGSLIKIGLCIVLKLLEKGKAETWHAFIHTLGLF